MLKIGPFTLRMLLFILTTFLSLSILLITKKLERHFAILILLYSSLLTVGIVMAIINKNPVELILEDLKPLIFFYNLLFFSLIIIDQKTIIKIKGILKASSLILALVYFMFILGLYTGYINYQKLYVILDATGEVFFRGTSGFFYKGFLYLCIGVFFFTDKVSLKNSLSIFLLITALVLTFTRGFLLSMALVAIIHMMFFSRKKVLSFIILSLGSIFLYFYLPAYLDALGDKSTSNNERIRQITDVKNAFDPFSLIAGHGFGGGVPSRPVHMEISYLEIYHKQGVLGLIFWGGLMLSLLISFYKAQRIGNRQLALPFLLASLFVYLQSLTNPFLNNPIGMSLVLISVVVLKRLETIKMEPAL
ncbi:MAG: hypothetical protein H7Y07_08300 [Pyrinomonadaceae bacterium]|nr:hypothetical protein [Sphingobacteriaceae bacterium]